MSNVRPPAARGVSTVRLAASLLLLSAASLAQLPSVVTGAFEISDGLGGFSGELAPTESFGYAVETIGDVDGDGLPDLAVGTNLDGDGGTWTGAVWILFMQVDGTVRDQQKISALEGGLVGPLESGGRFGSSVGALGDLDGDGVVDLAVGANYAGVGGTIGVVWILYLNADGTVRDEVRIDGNTPALDGLLVGSAYFGRAVEPLGDLDGDGLVELAVGAWRDQGGAVYILSLQPDGGVAGARRIASGSSGFVGPAANNFGISLACLDELDGDGVVELAVGANAANNFRGEVWILFLDADGSVHGETRIAKDSGGFSGRLEADDLFGTSLAPMPDRDRDGVQELAVGAVFDSDDSDDAGAVWILYLEADGTVDSWQKISDTEGSLPVDLTFSEYFGSGVAVIDPAGDGGFRLAVGAANDNHIFPPETGSVWMLTLNPGLWREHGLGLGGSAGVPRLRGEGLLSARRPTRLWIRNGAPFAPATLVLGLAEASVPFRGGTLFPSPDVLVAPVALDGAGGVDFEFSWPQGLPPGFTVFYQAWIADAGGPQGFSATNGVSSRNR